MSVGILKVWSLPDVQFPNSVLPAVTTAVVLVRLEISLVVVVNVPGVAPSSA